MSCILTSANSGWRMSVRTKKALPEGPEGPKESGHHSQSAESLVVSKFTAKKNQCWVFLSHSRHSHGGYVRIYTSVRRARRSSTCEATYNAHVMISGNVGIAVMPREKPITASMKTSSHSWLHTTEQKEEIHTLIEKISLPLICNIIQAKRIYIFIVFFFPLYFLFVLLLFLNALEVLTLCKIHFTAVFVSPSCQWTP